MNCRRDASPHKVDSSSKKKKLEYDDHSPSNFAIRGEDKEKVKERYRKKSPKPKEEPKAKDDRMEKSRKLGSSNSPRDIVTHLNEIKVSQTTKHTLEKGVNGKDEMEREGLERKRGDSESGTMKKKRERKEEKEKRKGRETMGMEKIMENEEGEGEGNLSLSEGEGNSGLIGVRHLFF